MPNTHYLEGFKCPECGHEDSFKIAVDVVMRVFDDGIEDMLSDTCWDDESYCECDSCSYHATIKDFTCSST